MDVNHCPIQETHALPSCPLPGQENTVLGPIFEGLRTHLRLDGYRLEGRSTTVNFKR